MKLSSDIYFNAASWFPGNVRVKPHFNTQCLPKIGSFWHLCDDIFWPVFDPCPPLFADLLNGWPSTWMRLFGLGSFNIVHLEEIFKELTNFRHSAPTLPPSLPAPPPPPFALFRYVVCTYLYSMYILRDSLKPYIITK